MPTRAAAGHKLDFNEKLIQTGKGGGVDALLKRLKTLHIKLKALDQDAVDLKTVHKVTKQLIDPVILHHKDRGVKAYAACCLADILRLYAPEAPYTADELRDIFQFFVVQVTQNLKLSPNATRPLAPSKRANDSLSQTTLTSNSRITEIPYYTEYSTLLDNLASVKSVVIIVDLPGAEDMITTYFESFVEVVRADMNKQLIRNLVSILVEVLNEADSVPSGVMDCVLNQFESYASKPDTPSLQLIVDVCNRSAVKLQRPTFAHFSEIQLSHGRDPSPTDLKTLSDSHSLILTIFRNSPNLLLNVIPLLEENLRAADETPLRQLSTQTLGSMFGERPVVSGGVVDIARSYPSTWRSWLGRRVDKALPVRVAWIEAARGILINHPDLRKELEPNLIERTQDSDEKARAAICKVIGSLDYETALHHVSKSLLLAIGVRMSDKKAVVRSEAVTALAKLWSQAQSEIEANDEDAIDQFAWIPQEMLHAVHRAVGAEARTQISVAFKTHVLPLPSKPDDEQAWVDRFLLVASNLDDIGVKALDRLTGIIGYAKGLSPYRAFVDLCEETNTVDKDKEAVTRERFMYVNDAIVRALFGDSEKARKDLSTFASVNEPRMYKLFRTLVDPQSDLRAIVKARNELLRRLEQSHTSLLETFSTLIDSAAWMVINHSSIPGLIKRIQKPEGSQPDRVVTVAGHYLGLIAKHCAPMYKSHVPELVIIIGDKKNDILVEVGLQGLAAVCKWDADCGPTDKRPVERAMHLALNGTPRQAKFATRFIAHCKDEKAAPKLLSSIWDALQEGNDTRLLPLLRSSAEMALVAPQIFENKAKEITSYILNDILPQRSPSEEELDDRWVEDEELETLDRAKILGLQVLTHRTLGQCRHPNAVEIAEPIFTLLHQILINDGQVSDETREGGQAKVHMRLRAALCFIKLARVRSFDKAMTPYFFQVAVVMQDPIFVARQRMLSKLLEILPPQRLLPRWNVLPILIALDPEQENILAAKSIMAAVVRTASQRTEDRMDRIEMPLARLLQLLTVHPDSQWDTAEHLKDMARFIELFVECVAHRDNVSLLYTIAAKLKTVTLADEKPTDEQLQIDQHPDPANSEGVATINLYKLAELAMIILRNRAQNLSWPLSMYPGAIKLPGDIFHNLPSPSYAQRVSRKSYLPAETEEWAKNFGRKGGAAAGGMRRPADPSREPRKRKSTTTSRAPRSKKRRSSGHASDSDDDDDVSDDDSDEEEDEEEESADELEESDGGNAVMGRGGRRSAKTKAKKAVGKKRKSASKLKPVAAADESELSDLSD